jgi:hypothetical protein
MEIITDLMAANAGDAELVRLCTDVMNNIENHEKHFALSQYLMSKDIDAKDYLEEYHKLCYINVVINGVKNKEWRNAAGQVHCLTKDKNGCVYPARVSEFDTKRWFKEGKYWSPGFDSQGYSLPTEVGTWAIWRNEDGETHRLELDKDGNPLPAFCPIIGVGKKQWWAYGEKYNKNTIMTLFSPINKLMASNSSDAELVQLCTNALKNLEDNEKHFALSQYLQKKNIVAEEYYAAYHDKCYTMTMGVCERFKVWKNAEGKEHCSRKDKNGIIMPARTSIDGVCAWWMIDGKPISPGFDENGCSLPDFVGREWKIWRRDNGVEHRIEIDKDGKFLPSSIRKDGYMEFRVNSIKMPQEHLQKKYGKRAIIEELMRRTRDNVEIQNRCKSLLLMNITNNADHYVLDRCITLNNINADLYYAEFHEYCYIRLCDRKEWHNPDGKRHCIRKDKDGNIYPAVIESNAKWWYKDGECFSSEIDGVRSHSKEVFHTPSSPICRIVF